MEGTSKVRCEMEWTWGTPITLDDGREIPFDPDSLDVCRFLNSTKLHGIHEFTRFFCSEQLEVFLHACRDQNLRLHFEENGILLTQPLREYCYLIGPRYAISNKLRRELS